MIQNLETAKCKEALGANYIGRLAYVFDNKPHIVPTTYYYDDKEKAILCFAANGHRLQAMRKEEQVSFQVDEIESMEDWRSIQVHGTFQELHGLEAGKYLKRFAEGVQDTIDLKREERPKFIQHFSTTLQQSEMPVVYRILVTDIIGKIKKEKY